MIKEKVHVSIRFCFSAVLTACTLLAASFLSVMPISVAAASTDSTAPQTVTGGESADRMANDSSIRRILEEYAGKLNFLYGNSYTAYLQKGKEEFDKRMGFDSTEIPASNAAFRIDDYDRDGTEELLIVSVNEDSSLKLTMYEVVEGQQVSPADSYDAVIHRNGYDIYAYAAEQGGGYTHVFSYEKGGPCIGIDSSGQCIQATGRMRTILTVKYDGSHFIEEGEPYIDRTSGSLTEDDSMRSIRRMIESFGTLSLMDRDVTSIFNGSSIDKYLPDVHEIMKTNTVSSIDWDLYSEWCQEDNPDKMEVSSIRFAERNELYSTEINERFSGMLSSHIPVKLTFADELDNRGTVQWSTGLSAFGENGNLYYAGYYYVSPDEKAREENVEFRFKQLSIPLWETKEGIYLLPEMNEEERKLLLEEGTLPENTALIYSETDQPDPLDVSAEGNHHSIEKYSGEIRLYKDVIFYRGYRIPGKGLEARDCKTFISKKDKGLIGYQSSRTPAGADLIRVWDPQLVEIDDMRLDVR